jgi:hypothetical protein
MVVLRIVLFMIPFGSPLAVPHGLEGAARHRASDSKLRLLNRALMSPTVYIHTISSAVITTQTQADALTF